MIKAHCWSTPKFPYTSLDFVKILSTDIKFFILETSAHSRISQGTWPFRDCRILPFPFSYTWKSSKALCTLKCKWDQGKRLISEPSTTQADKWTSLQQLEKAARLSVYTQMWARQGEKAHFRALHCPSRQVDKPQKIRKDRFPTCHCFAHLSFPHRQGRDCSWLAGRAEHGQPTHAAASPPALLPSRLEQHFPWFTKHPRRGLFLELISFPLLHLAIPRHL